MFQDVCERAELGRDWALGAAAHVVSLLSDDGMAIEKIARLARPARSGCPAWRECEPGCGQDSPDRSGADAVPEAEEFALDAPVSPSRVLPGQPLVQLTDLFRDRRAWRIQPVSATPGGFSDSESS